MQNDQNLNEQIKEALMHTLTKYIAMIKVIKQSLGMFNIHFVQLITMLLFSLFCKKYRVKVEDH